MPAPTGVHHYDSILGLKAVVEGLGLDGLPNADPLPPERVYAREALSDRGVQLPCVVIALAPMPEVRDIGDSTPAGRGDNWIGYPSIVAVLAAQNQDLTLDQGKLSW